MNHNPESGVHEAMAAITRAWRENRPLEMRSSLHPEVAMVLPHFSGTLIGADNLVASFVEFCANARVVVYEQSDEQIQVTDDVAFLSYRFTMIYDRSAYRERSEGRDIWAFRRTNGTWLAIWRAMVDLKDAHE